MTTLLPLALLVVMALALIGLLVWVFRRQSRLAGPHSLRAEAGQRETPHSPADRGSSAGLSWGFLGGKG